MYENMTFENIMERCLARVPDTVDKREGSVIYDAIAPAAAELAEMYINLGTILDRAFPDTATGRDLTLKAMERGIKRQPATYAQRKGEFKDPDGNPMDIPIGSRFSGGDVNYTATARIEPGAYNMAVETAGTIGNMYSGNLLPIDFIEGLGSAILSDVLIPGEEEESDDDLRARYFESLNIQAFGGNVQDYKEKTKGINGVGGVKVYPVWNGGGTVRLAIVTSDWGVPSPTLIETVQETIDPIGNQGVGLGIAPIGHVVTVEGVTAATIDISSQITLQPGYTWDSVKSGIIAAISEYFTDLIKAWEDTDNIVVRISQIETRTLDIPGVLDITGTKINGNASNLVLGPDEIPVLGDVTNETAD